MIPPYPKTYFSMKKSIEKISLLIADDHALVRESWSSVLNDYPGFTVIGECSSAEEAVETAKRLKPQVVIMDINLPEMNGMEATRQIAHSSCGSKVIGFSTHSEAGYARKMIQAGAMGYVTKNSSREELFYAIEEVAAGRKYICKEVTGRF